MRHTLDISNGRKLLRNLYEVLFGNRSCLFVSSFELISFVLRRYMQSYGFDGVDVAFEFPDDDVPEDKISLITLLEVRSFQRRSRGKGSLF